MVDLANACPDKHFVIKEHPYSRSAIWDKVATHPRIHFQNGGNTNGLIERCGAVLTVNSTVGIEAISRGRKVVMLGEACYDIPDLVQRARTLEELSAIIGGIDDWQLKPELQQGFIRFLTHEFLLGGAGQLCDETMADYLLALPNRTY